MASGYSSSFAKETDSTKNNPANLVLLFVVSVFLTYNAGCVLCALDWSA
jgi:hypothetical protein